MSENKPLPHNDKAEKYILGGILLDNSLASQCVGDLPADGFYNATNKNIYQAIEVLYDKGSDINSITLVEELKTLGIVNTISYSKEIGGIINELRKGLPKPKDLQPYIKILKQKATERAKIRLSALYQNALLDGDTVGAADAEQKLNDLAIESEHLGAEHTQDFSGKVLNKVFTTGTASSRITGLATGIYDFDILTAGIQETDLVILAARPSAGKTAMALNIAHFASVKSDEMIVVFSIEMSKELLLMRMLSSESRVSMTKIKTGILDLHEWARLVHAQKVIDNANIYIDDSTENVTAARFKNVVKKLQRKGHKIGLIAIDYMQLMNSNRRAENRQQEVTQISRDLKLMAKALHIPVLALSQLSRAPEQRTGNNHRPKTSDLRESGAIEQDADIVAFIYRAEMYEKTAENEGLAELIISKHRNGATGTIPLVYLKEFTRFENLFMSY